MQHFIDHYLAERRTLDQAIADLRATYAQDPTPDLADMVRHGEAEMLHRVKESEVGPN